jgi:phosphopantetheinyl transferase
MVHIVYTEHGKPLLADSRAEISVTHSGDHVAAISSPSGKVGIDVEQLRDRIYRVSDKFLSGEEMESIGTENRLEKLYIYWGAKEALYKLHGKPEVEFRRDIYVETFDYLCEGKGQCRALMQTPSGRSAYDIYYENLAGFMLVYALSNLET